MTLESRWPGSETDLKGKNSWGADRPILHIASTNFEHAIMLSPKITEITDWKVLPLRLRRPTAAWGPPQAATGSHRQPILLTMRMGEQGKKQGEPPHLEFFKSFIAQQVGRITQFPAVSLWAISLG